MNSSASTSRLIFRATVRIFQIAAPPRKLLLLAALAVSLASLFQIFSLGLLIPMLNGLVDPLHYEALFKTYPMLTKVFNFLSIPKENKSIFLVTVVLILACVYLENLLLFLGQSRSAQISTTVAHTLRDKCFRRLSSFSKPFYDKRNVGQLQTILTSFVTAVSQHIHHISMLLVTLTFAFGFLMLMLIISWRLTASTFILLPITHFLAKRLSRRLSSSSQGEVNHMISYSDRISEILRNISLTQLSNQEASEAGRLSSVSDLIRQNGYVARRRRFAIPRIVDAVNSTGIVILACVAAFIFFKMEASSIGRLSAFFIALRRLTSHLESALNYWTQTVANVPTLHSVIELFEDSGKSFPQSGEREFLGLRHEIRFSAVSFRYPGTNKGLEDINLVVPRGSTLAVIGETGGGKSTLVRLLCAFYQQQSGDILIDGEPIGAFEISSYRRKLAVVEQRALVFSDTLRANICYGLSETEFSAAELSDAIAKAALSDFVASLPQGLETLVGKKGMELSGGEAQRVAIARALLKKPDILVLDEATSALDGETELAVQNALDTLPPSCTKIIIAHRLSTIRGADNVIVMKQGMIIEQGSAADLLEQDGTFRRLHEIQFSLQ